MNRALKKLAQYATANPMALLDADTGAAITQEMVPAMALHVPAKQRRRFHGLPVGTGLYTPEALKELLCEGALPTMRDAQAGRLPLLISAVPADGDTDALDALGSSIGRAHAITGVCFTQALYTMRTRQCTPLLETIATLAYPYYFTSPVPTFSSIDDLRAVLHFTRVLFATDAAADDADNNKKRLYFATDAYDGVVDALTRLITDAMLLGLFDGGIQLALWLDLIVGRSSSTEDEWACERALVRFLISRCTDHGEGDADHMLRTAGETLASRWRMRKTDKQRGMPPVVGTVLAALVWARAPKCRVQAVRVAITAAAAIVDADGRIAPNLLLLVEGACAAAATAGHMGVARDLAVRFKRSAALQMYAHPAAALTIDAACATMFTMTSLFNVYRSCGKLADATALWYQFHSLATLVFEDPAAGTASPNDTRRCWLRYTSAIMYPPLLAAAYDPARVKYAPPPVHTVVGQRTRYATTIVQHYLDAGGSPDARDPATLDPLLHIAFVNGAVVNARALLAAGANHDIRDARGRHVLFRLIAATSDAGDGPLAVQLVELLHKYAGDYIWSLHAGE